MIAIPFRARISCTVEEACWATGLGRTTIYKLIKEGRIEAKKIGRRTVILVSTLLVEIESCGISPSGDAEETLTSQDRSPASLDP
jgi:excisionase family DNA binding protein